MIARFHHVDGAFEPEELARERHGRTPLACACFGGDPAHAFLLVVVGLRQGCIQFVTTGRTDALVFEVDAAICLQRFLKTDRTHERSGAPNLVELAHLIGNLDPALRRHLLLDDRLGEKRREVCRRERLAGAWVQRRRKRARGVSQHVIPCRWNFAVG